MSSSTPSPTASAAVSTSSSRRPPRKSTLTQQQKNQKRQRATQDQLATLEVEFNKNPTPTATVRERIAQDINMTERSVQIWFQNRRAKIKLLAKKSIETGEDCDAIPDSMRQYLAIQAMESGKPFARSFLARPGGPMTGYGNHGLPFNAESGNSSKVVIHHFACRSLSIGSWRRVGQNAMDLVVFYSPDKACLTYYINNDSAGYKIEYPFANIKNISLENGDPLGGADGSPQRPGGLLIELNRPPNFFMDSSGSGGFYQCGDFTEDQQASQVMVHHLGGHSKVLSGQLAKLVSLDSFQNRHHPFESNIMSASAPVSPISHRPASQPNHASHPYLGMWQENPFGMSLHPGARGHKRTRSRSVPVAIDFSMLQSPMPSFHIQHPSTTISDPNIYAPIPQHSNNFGPLGANLRIDTTSGYGLDFRPYPMSAATTTSPSEYASPGFFTSAALTDTMPAVNFNTPYSLPFLSPMIDHPNMMNPSVSPLSSVSHGDPVIADQSPQLSNMHRSASADFLSMSQDPRGSISDDGLMLSEMYSKQSLNLPLHSPHLEDSALGMHMQEEGSSEEMDMHSMVAFGTINPSSLSPENRGL
ncbi:Transcription elongation factor SPT4 [Acarospora aff. strigata]|nr:Transcription elongation factor SPT4 [Acarospora aff. strigata]